MGGNGEPLLRVEGLTKRFGGLVAVNNVSFAVYPGEIVGLIGPNGAGKTTLFSLLVGAQPPTAGAAWLRGRQVTGLPPHQVVALGMVRTHQIVRPFREMTVLENVVVGATFGRRRLDLAAARRKAGEVLEFVGLAHRAGAPAGTLSIGELKLLEIARALATDPELILLDEVMGGLNPAEINNCLDLIRRLRQRGVTVMLIEHHIRAVASVCDRIVVLHQGEKIAEGPARAVLNDPVVITAYLGEAVPAGAAR